MIDFFQTLHPTLQASVAGLFTWSMTALGAGLIYLIKHPRKTFMDGMLSFASGIMIAASFWSLLLPAFETAQRLHQSSALMICSGFLCGGLFLYLADVLFHFINAKSTKRSFLLIFSMTLHNIPEGFAVGVGFGSLLYHQDVAALMNACLLALGIGLQNFPEGTAISFPLLKEGTSRHKAFFYGQISGLVEPVCALLGAYMMLHIQRILPFTLSFAAGAMIYVVVVELIPESQSSSQKGLMALFTLLGFVVMMFLDMIFTK